ncbi:uncharacterized protein LTR77_009097 [Saxophila tyrrhenica]|uniref:GATA-type domain-containing protein n=1 Tax=Saxophila tyrrhenica TaxID=1690608 RepID=A0AAV9NZI8_9PEZI|nr:hypothetical protein LTR77_009097 [Saxophila tyrrhenica]
MADDGSDHAPDPDERESSSDDEHQHSRPSRPPAPSPAPSLPPRRTLRSRAGTTATSRPTTQDGNTDTRPLTVSRAGARQQTSSPDPSLAPSLRPSLKFRLIASNTTTSRPQTRDGGDNDKRPMTASSADEREQPPAKKAKFVLSTGNDTSDPPLAIPGQKLCSNRNFDHPLGNFEGPGPNGRLCETDYNRYRQARRTAEASGQPIKDDWALTGPSRKTTKDPGFKATDPCANTNFPHEIGTKSHPLPSGGRLCDADYQRRQRASKKAQDSGQSLTNDWALTGPFTQRKQHTQRTLPKWKATDLCANTNYPHEIGLNSKPTTSGRMCNTDYQRWLAARRDAEVLGRPLKNDWVLTELRHKPFWTGKWTEPCSNTNFPHEVGAKSESGPSGRLCQPDASRYRKALKKARNSGQPLKNDWALTGPIRRKPGHERAGDLSDASSEASDPSDSSSEGSAASDYEMTCVDCERLESQGWEVCENGAVLCQACARRRRIPTARRMRLSQIPQRGYQSHTALRHLAYRSWRELNPVGPSESMPQPTFATTDYWSASPQELAEMIMRRRGDSSTRFRGTMDSREARNWLQIDDACDGLLPRPDPAQSDILHDKQVVDLEAMCKAKGMKLGRNTTKQDMLKWLSTHQRQPSDFMQQIDPDKLAALTTAMQLFFDSLPRDLTAQATRGHSLVASSAAVLEDLQQTILQGFAPVWTDSAGLLCGLEALRTALFAFHRADFPHSPLSNVMIEGLRLMRLLYTNADDPTPPGDDPTHRVGMPTPAYEQYIRDTATTQDEAVLNDRYTEMTQMYNLDIAQLGAMVHLAHREGLIEHDLNIGVVRSAYINEQGNVVPAFASIEYEGNEQAPIIWLHLNLAAGQGQYNHWEAFSNYCNPEDADIVHDWGLLHLGDTLDTTTLELTRARYREQHHWKHGKYTAVRACHECRKYDRTRTCFPVPGVQHCRNCFHNPDGCIYDEGTRPRDLWTSASLIPIGGLRPWDTPLSWNDQVQAMKNTQLHLPDPEPEGIHFVGIGSARQSRRGGPGEVLNIMQDLAISLHTYDNKINDPQIVHLPEGQRPGGPGVPMRKYRMVFARNGSMALPTHTGNLQDPTLIGIVNFINHITDPANLNQPIETHWFLMGYAGYGVDITRWGDRQQGFFAHVLSRSPAVANSMYLVPAVERHVVSAVSPTSINPNMPPHGVMVSDVKFVTKYLLAYVIDRHEQLQNIASRYNLNFLDMMMHLTGLGPPNGIPPNVIPPNVSVYDFVWPPGYGGAAEAARLDRLIMAMHMEMAWRVEWLDGMTRPREVFMHANNVNRNGVMQ